MSRFGPSLFSGMRSRRKRDELKIVFVHSPMATLPVNERKIFWQNFDRRYHAAHPGLHHMRRTLWELPHWMTWLAGVLVSKGYTDVAALDFYASECALSGIDASRVLQALQLVPADVYLFSPMTPNLPFACEIATLIKSLYPEAAIVFGGVIATPLHKHIAKHSSVDYVVFGRGEVALVELLDAIRGAKDIGDVGQISYRATGNTVVTNEKVYAWMHPQELPFPMVDLFPEETGLDLRYLRVVYALGCPYSCQFCTIQTIGRRPSYFPITRVVEEIRAYRVRYGEHHNIYFGDETFTVNTEQTIALCNALRAERNIQYDCQTRLNLVADKSMLSAMERSGCRWIELGVESVDQDTQDSFKQRVKLDSLVGTLERLRDAGLPACSFLVNGFPNQTLDNMRRSIELVAELIARKLLQASYLFGLVPYPGSALYHKPEDYGLTLHHHDFRLYHEDLPPVFSTRYADPEAIYRVFLEGLDILGEAMEGSPHFGEFERDVNRETYGSFWQDSHV